MDAEISAADLRTLLDEDADVRIVDIRSPSAYRRGHIPGSVNVPFGELTSRIDEVAEAERVVTVCPHGEASVQAARLVQSYEDFSGRVESLACGVDGWPYDLEPGGRDSDGSSDTGQAAADEGPEAPF